MPKQKDKGKRAQKRRIDEKLRLPRGERGGDSLAQIEAREKRELEAAAPSAEELELQASIFGGTDAAALQDLGFGDEQHEGAASEVSSEDEGVGGAWPAALASIGMDADEDKDEDEEDDQDGKSTGESDLREIAGMPVQKRAWVDDDDEDLVVDLSAVNRLRKLRKSERETAISGADYAQRLREQHRKLHPGVEWSAKARSKRTFRGAGRVEGLDANDSDGEREAQDSLSDEDEDEDSQEMFADVTRRAGGSVTVEGKPQRLAPDELGVKRATNANVAAVSNCVVQSVEFHRNSQLMLTAGFDQCLRLFSIDGLRNPLTQQVFMKDMPIHTASFTPDGKSIVMTGRRKYFYTYDLERATVQRVPRIIGREEKSLEKFVLSPDNKWIAFLVRIVLPDVLANTPFTARLRGSVSLTCRSGVLVGTGRRGIYSAVLQSDKRMGRVAEDGGQRTLPGLQPGFNDTDLGRCARLFHIARFHTHQRVCVPARARVCRLYA